MRTWAGHKYARHFSVFCKNCPQYIEGPLIHSERETRGHNVESKQEHTALTTCRPELPGVWGGGRGVGGLDGWCFLWELRTALPPGDDCRDSHSQVTHNTGLACRNTRNYKYQPPTWSPSCSMASQTSKHSSDGQLSLSTATLATSNWPLTVSPGGPPVVICICVVDWRHTLTPDSPIFTCLPSATSNLPDSPGSGID